MRSILFLAVLAFPFISIGQPVADFTVPSAACIGQGIRPVNNSSNSTRYEWDFCQGDLGFAPLAEASALAAGNANIGLDIVQDGNSWFGFVTDASNNTIIRLSYGANVNSTPTKTSLGTIFPVAVTPYDIKVVSDNGNWYGFVYGVDRTIMRLDFGTSLTNTPTSTTLVTGNGSTSGLDVVQANGKWHLVYTQFFITTVVRLNTITTVPTAGDIISFNLSNTALRLGDIKVFQNKGKWFAYAPTYDGAHTLQKFAFGTTLFSTPTITDITGSVVSTIIPFGIDGGVDNGNYVLFASTVTGTVARINLGPDLDLAPAGEATLGNFGVLANTLKIVLRKSGTEWNAYTIAYTTGQTYKLAFPGPPCQSSVSTSAVAAPDFSYSASGTYFATLRSFNGNTFDEQSTPITVSTLSSPTLDINVNGICFTHPSVYSFTSTQPISSVSWDLGNAVTSTQTSPSTTYGATGDYEVELKAVANNGCAAVTREIISIFNSPTANFTPPNPSVVCSNQDYVFTNTSTSDAGSTPTWQWSVDGTNASTTKDLSKAFPSSTTYSVKLAASIPGCVSEITKPFTITQTGPSVDFTSNGKCQNTAITFDNTTTGATTSLSWDFGDSGAATGASANHTFATNGTFNVVLTATNAAGCVNSKMKPLQVFSKPVPAFSLDLPPFSCSGTPSQFHDATPPLSDSNIQSWVWTFGDTGTGTGKNPTHIYAQAGQYTVRLSVTTDNGCSDFKDQQVTITQSPSAAFNLDPACVNQPTKFTDASTSGVTSWQWKIGSAVYSSQNPTHTFTTSGNASAQLTVTGQNSCTNTITKQVTVPVVPVVDFTSQNLCSAQSAVFTDITNGNADPITQQVWAFNNTGSGTGKTSEFTFVNSGTFPVQLKVTAQSGCSYTLTRNVAIKASPVASFTVSDQSGPPPLRVVFTNTSVGATSYEWNFNDGTSNVTTASPEHTYNNLGDYTANLTAVSIDGCRKSDSKVISVVVPKVELALNGLSLVQPPGASAYRGYVKVRNNGTYRVEGFAVNYDIGGGVLLRESVVASLKAGEEGTFMLQNQFLGPASSSYVCAELDADTNLEDNKACAAFTDFSVILAPHPNPAASTITVETVSQSAGQVGVKMYSMSGALAFDGAYHVAAGLSRLSLNIQNLSDGMYVVVITAGGVSSSQRILVAR